MDAHREQVLGLGAAESAALLHCSQRPSAFRARFVYLLHDLSFNINWWGGVILTGYVSSPASVGELLKSLIFCSVSCVHI